MTSTLPLPVSTRDFATDYDEIVAKMATISQRMTAWNDEWKALLKLDSAGTITERQSDRLSDLGSSLDFYQDYLDDLGDIPTETWVRRTLEAPGLETALQAATAHAKAMHLEHNAMQTPESLTSKRESKIALRAVTRKLDGLQIDYDAKVVGK